MPPWLLPVGLVAMVAALITAQERRKRSAGAAPADGGGASGSPSSDDAKSQAAATGDLNDLLRAMGLRQNSPGQDGGGGGYSVMDGSYYSGGGDSYFSETSGPEQVAGDPYSAPANLSYKTPYGTIQTSSPTYTPVTSVATLPGAVLNTIQGSVAGVGGAHGNN